VGGVSEKDVCNVVLSEKKDRRKSVLKSAEEELFAHFTHRTETQPSTRIAHEKRNRIAEYLKIASKRAETPRPSSLVESDYVFHLHNVKNKEREKLKNGNSPSPHHTRHDNGKKEVLLSTTTQKRMGGWPTIASVQGARS